MVRLKIMGLFPSIHMDPYYPGCLGPLLNFKWSNTKTGKTQFSRFLWRFLVLVGRYNHIINEEGLRHLSEPRKSKDMHMGGSINGGTTKSAIFNRIFSINHPAIGATPIYGNPQIDIYIYIHIYIYGDKSCDLFPTSHADGTRGSTIGQYLRVRCFCSHNFW